jgi:capsular exopolysaccharide synthesis family protein
MPEFTGTKDLRGYLRMLWRWKLLLLVFLLGAPIAAFLIERGKPNVYQSSALVGVNQTTVNTALLNNSGTFSTTNVTAIAELVTTTPVADVAASLMRPPASPGQIVGEVTAKGDATTNFLRITAQDRSAVRAAQIANAFARAISLNVQRSAVTQINSTIKGIRAQLKRLSPADTVTRPQLEQQLNQLLASRSAQGSEAAILQAATPSAAPAGPHLRRTVELALLIGLLLGLGVVVMAENADRRLRTPDALEDLADVPLLATIALSAFSGTLDTGPADEEAFQMLRTALLGFNPSAAHQSVVITSPGEKDGKTTVAVRLALAAARAGLRAVLVDADLRRAQVGTRLGISNQDGLGAVLAGHRLVEEVLVAYPIDEPGASPLAVLPAGAPPANPAALISSPKMELVLRHLEAIADLVVIDTPAALMVSDSLVLMELATGVVLVARVNRSTRDKVGRLRRMVSAAGGSLFGVVATGASTGPRYGHYASKYYTQNGTRAPGRRRVRQPAGPAVSQAGETEEPVSAPQPE